MWYLLNCYGHSVKARRLLDGRLKFPCPFCDEPVLLKTGWVVYTENHVRTVRRVFCPYPRCDMPYEIKHSNFVAEDDETGHPKYMVKARRQRQKILQVWRTHNDR